eukprot:CAMPEP_0205905488 /NCGR_PEP_ID=MMETSP1325-20131115/1380_1 /ASSEMBLY_ACC=CAM_ASM_000708 /TAXON_ID=236786 /ORGANISM="Florenciella sp., Strain RCC1007" /LENGTH=171 /DNA_ID=CAMNT_0053271399 /DNA_START=281 /DNA_END=797 /DNA_ORIENTATION=+
MRVCGFSELAPLHAGVVVCAARGAQSAVATWLRAVGHTWPRANMVRVAESHRTESRRGAGGGSTPRAKHNEECRNTKRDMYDMYVDVHDHVTCAVTNGGGHHGGEPARRVCSCCWSRTELKPTFAPCDGLLCSKGPFEAVLMPQALPIRADSRVVTPGVPRWLIAAMGPSV